MSQLEMESNYHALHSALPIKQANLVQALIVMETMLVLAAYKCVTNITFAEVCLFPWQ